jgi:hygromycin-B 4-O-kinase
LGRYAALLNSIPTLGFGASFNWAGDGVPSRPAWHDFLHTELKLDGRLDTLRVRRMLPDNRLRKIRSILEGACGRGRRPALNHGDLRLKNVIVDDKGEISTILDWEDCISSLAPEWELSLALHDLTIDEKQVFVRGYGLRPKDFTAIAPVIKALNIINYVAEVERLARDKNRAELESCRMRLSGSLDLYCI